MSGWEEYREALLARPDAIELSLEQIEGGRAYVAERQGEVAGFSVVLPRQDGDADLDGLFVEPVMWKRGIGRRLIQEAECLTASEGAKVTGPHHAQATGIVARTPFRRR